MHENFVHTHKKEKGFEGIIRIHIKMFCLHDLFSPSTSKELM